MQNLFYFTILIFSILYIICDLNLKRFESRLKSNFYGFESISMIYHLSRFDNVLFFN